MTPLPSVRRLALAALAVIIAVVGVAAFAARPIVAQEPTRASDGAPVGIRVGTFDRTKLLVAYYRSEIHDAAIERLRVEREAALERGDEERAKEIEAEGGRMQERAHRQLAGEATLANVLPHLKEHLPAIAAEARVSMIVELSWFRDETVHIVDVTDHLVALLEPVDD